MDVTPRLADDAEAVKLGLVRAQRGLVDREVLGDVVALCAVAREHVLVVGPPGTGKSEAVRRVAAQAGGVWFEYLLGRFTEPSELFGPVDLQRLREGVVQVQTAGMLPEAEVVFLDEVFLGSTAILNTLLGVLNERVYRRGRTVQSCPLRVCVGATNSLPDDPALAAFADRFLARVFVEPVGDDLLEQLLASRDDIPGAGAGGEGPLLPALDRLAEAAATCDLREVRSLTAFAVRRLRTAGVPLSDRRVVRTQRLLAAAAALDGRGVASPADLWVLPLVAPTAEAQTTARDALADLLDAGRSGTLPSAAEEYARGAAARAARLEAAGRRLLDEHGSSPGDPDLLLRVEGVLREVDAGFAAADLPDDLRRVREGLREVRVRGSAA